MTDSTQREGSARPSGERLRPYHRPRMLVYGALNDLTAGGSGNSKEDNPGTPDKPRP